MKINRIEIDAFGKFNKFALDLSDGFLIIHGGNEDGKTTLMDFIKLILYSKADNARSLQNPRRKYVPFSGRPPAGALVVERGGMQYVMQKSIGDTPGKDRARIINVKTGVEEPLRNQEAGQWFTGLDAEGFDQICFIDDIGRINAPVGFNTEEQTIANLTGSGDKRVSRQVILKRLTDAKESLVSKNGKNGCLVDLKAKLQRLKNEKVQIDFTFQKQAALTEEYNTLREKYTEQRKLKSIVESLGIRDDMEKIEKLLAMIKDRSKDQTALSRPNIPASRMNEYLDRLRQASDEYFSAKKILEEWSEGETGYDGLSIIQDADIDQYEAYEQRIIGLELEMNALPQEKVSKLRIPNQLQIPIMLLIAVSAVVAALLFGPMYLLLLFLLLIVFFSIKIGDRKTSPKREGFIKQIEVMRAQANVILDKYGCENTAQLREHYIAWKAHAKNLETQSRLETKLNMSESRFIALAELYEPVRDTTDAQMLMERLTTALSGMDRLNDSIHEQTRALGFETENPSEISARLAALKVKVSSELSGIDTDAALRRWSAIKDEDFSTRMLELQKNLKTPGYTPDQLDNEIKAVSTAAADMAVYYKALETAVSVMDEASDELRSGFGAELNRRAGLILSELTNGQYTDILIAKDYSLSIKSEAQYREYEYFSSGAIDQAYLALRLSLSEMTSEQSEPFPLLLDDSLMQYDDVRLRLALKHLSNRHGQTVLFTCHKHIVEAGRSLGAHIASIRAVRQS